MLAVLTFLGSPIGKLVGWGVVALVLLVTLAGVKHEWDLGQAARKQVAQIVHVSKVQTAAVAKVDKAAASDDAKGQTRIVTRIRTLTKKVPVYVSAAPSPPVGCITWGMLRLHDAAVLGVDPSTLPLPAGATDAACAPTSPAAFMAAVVGNYGAAEQNAQQLNDLEADVQARANATAGSSP